MGLLGIPMIHVQNPALPVRQILSRLDGSRWVAILVVPPRKFLSLPWMGLAITGNPWFFIVPFFKLFISNRLIDHLHRSRMPSPLATGAYQSVVSQLFSIGQVQFSSEKPIFVVMCVSM